MSARDDNPPADAAEPRRLVEDPGFHAAGAPSSWALGLLRGAEPYRTPAGRKQLARETKEWNKTADLIAAFLAPKRETT